MDGTSAIRRTSLVLLLVAVAVVAFPAVAFADCVPPPDIEQSLAQTDTAFVGEVTALDFDGRLATFHVLEVWKGVLEEEVIVNGGPDLGEMTAARARGEEVFTSVDRFFALGEVYLVLAHGADGPILRDGGCSNTQPFTAALGQIRPESAHPPIAVVEVAPSASGGNAGSSWVLPTSIAVAATMAAAGAWIVFRRREDTEYEIW